MRDHKGSKKEIKAKANKITGKNVPVKKPVEKKRLKKALAKKRIKNAAADYPPENVSVENPLPTPSEPLVNPVSGSMVPENLQFKAKLTARGHLNILKKICGDLSSDHLTKFKQSCFGQLLEVGEMKFLGQLYLYLLFNQDTSGSIKKVVFHLYDQEAIFGQMEFAVITSLNFGVILSCPTTSEFYNWVYGIAHVDGDHWVLYELDLATKHIIVYDSLSKSDIWSKYEHHFTGLAEMLSSIFNISDCGMQDHKVWQVGKMKHPPQQCNTSDCGIMCIKFLECLTTGRILDEIDPEKCGQYRKMLCCDLLDKYLD